MQTHSNAVTGTLKIFQSLIWISVIVLFFSCRESKQPPAKDIVDDRQELIEHKHRNLTKLITYAGENKDHISDSVMLMSATLVRQVYSRNNFQPLWSQVDTWRPIADSMFQLVDRAMEYGLFPQDLNSRELREIRKRFQADSLAGKDAALWARADVLLSDAYLTAARHLKLGRLERDSMTLRNDSAVNDAYFLQSLQHAVQQEKILTVLHSYEPIHQQYQQLKNGLRSFLDSALFVERTYIPFPIKDSALFNVRLRARLSEEGMLAAGVAATDTAALAAAVRTYQQARGMKVTGRISELLIRRLNNTDWEKFKTIALNLDRYKHFPEELPSTYAFVNLPAYMLYVYDADTLALQSKVIVGTPKTKTPLLTSRISNFITYPQWTVPYSIIFREMLPKIQKNIEYLDKQNLMVVDRNDEVIDPETVDWSKLDKKHFPYLLRQREGDDNSLGVIKFNFPNKHSVYLHDTNARSLFSRSSRALSHGCVRVQEWKKLSEFLTRSDTIRFPTDTLNAWISRQEKHTVTGFPRLPLYIRYFTVEGKGGKLRFYEDIYGDDRLLKERYFSGKRIG